MRQGRNVHRSGDGPTPETLIFIILLSIEVSNTDCYIQALENDFLCHLAIARFAMRNEEVVKYVN